MSSLALPEIHEHKLPAGSSVLTPSLCNNCARRVYVQYQGAALCLPCAPIAERGAMVWGCLDCGTQRVRASHREDTLELWRLKCVRCLEVTEHRFVRVA